MDQTLSKIFEDKIDYTNKIIYLDKIFNIFNSDQYVY